MLPSKSLELELSNPTPIGARPSLGVAVNAAVGGWLNPTTLTGGCAVAVAPPSSVIVSVAVYSPGAVWGGEGVAPVPVAPSPNCHAYPVPRPSASLDAEASKETLCG